MDVAGFRAAFSEFGDVAAFPADRVSYWLGVAALRVDPAQWGDMAPHGVALLTAHHLALSARNASVAARGGLPGATSGVMTAKAVDKVSASYDAGAVTIEGGAHFNATTYGVQFLELAMMFGAGGFQL